MYLYLIRITIDSVGVKSLWWWKGSVFLSSRGCVAQGGKGTCCSRAYAVSLLWCFDSEGSLREPFIKLPLQFIKLYSKLLAE